ncbi:MAG TPA: methyl-accepting chemotaxis protein [Spirochaetia bacterium]|nr:methyl-accepting chemotaxis protein [Spirochaetia bacterium]
MKSDAASRSAGGRGLRLRFRVWIAMCSIVVGTMVIFAVTTFLYTRTFFLSDLHDRIQNIVELGSGLINRNDLAFLIDRLGTDKSAESVTITEQSAEFRRVSDALNTIRGIQPNLILYAYTLAPTGDPAKARFVVDADVLELLKSGASSDEISHFNQLYDISSFGMMKDAFSGKVAVESEFTYDEAYKANSFSGYAPLMSPDGSRVVALLGVDVTDKDVAVHLSRLRMLILIAIISVTIITLIATYLISRALLDPLDSFLKLFTEATSGDLKVRYAVGNKKDEIAQTARAFNGLMSRLDESMREVAVSSSQLRSSSDLVATTSGTIAAGSAQQVSSIEGTRGVVQGFMQDAATVRGAIDNHGSALARTVVILESLSQEAGRVAEFAVSVQEKAVSNIRNARAGTAALTHVATDIEAAGRNLEGVAERFEEVRVQSEQIDHVVQLIADMSERTNVLAINAAIEASRLGASGAGFKVVANEVKSIATAMADRTDEIGSIVGKIKSAISVTARVTRDSVDSFLVTRNAASDGGKLLTDIGNAMQEMEQLVAEIGDRSRLQGEQARSVHAATDDLRAIFSELGDASRGQEGAAREILTSMEELNLTASNNAEVAATLGTLAVRLTSDADELRHLLSRFRSGGNGHERFEKPSDPQ